MDDELRAKADAADRVRALADALDSSLGEGDNGGFSDGFDAGKSYSAELIRRALDGPP